MADRSRRYMAYMLRLWEVGGDDGACWRVSLESPHTGERFLLVDLDAFFEFLRRKTVAADDSLTFLPNPYPPGGPSMPDHSLTDAE